MINNMNTASSVLTRKSRIGFAVIGLLSLTLFYRAFSTHLIGDDYWWIYNAAYIMNKLSGWIAAFAFENASGFYRPLTQNVFFFVAYNLFGLHSFYYHIVSFVFVIFSGFFVYKIILTICEDNSSAIVGTSIFLFSSLLYSLIAWASAFSQTGSGFLYVLTIYLYIQGRKYRTWSYIGFILCLMSGEITSTLPAFLVLYEIVKQQNGLLASIRKTIYVWII
jgi:hypothetical protein